MENKLIQELEVPCYETDSACLLKPASFMDMAQELANRHATVLGFGFDDLQKTRTVWVLSRMHVIFCRHPRWREQVKLSTWHKGAARLFYLRDFKMEATDGTPLVLATTSWVIVDIDTRRLSRNTAILDDGTACMDNAVGEPCDKVQMPRDASPEFVRTHQVSYSDIDMNGHTNNAMYLVWAMDALEYDLTSRNPLKELKINFNQETRPGDSVELYRWAAPQGDSFIVEGRVDGRSAFCAELKF